jgi:hypothetical protein
MAVETAVFTTPLSFVDNNVTQRAVKGVRCLYLVTPDTADAADTFTVDLANHGGTRLLGVVGCRHTTANSVLLTENPTTTVSGTTVTLTIPAGVDNVIRVAKVFFV